MLQVGKSPMAKKITKECLKFYNILLEAIAQAKVRN